MPDNAPAIDQRPSRATPPSFVPGTPVSAGALNRLVEIAVGNTPFFRAPRPSAALEAVDAGWYPMRVIGEDGDSLICYPAGATRDPTQPITTVRVAKPYLLRRSPFDGADRPRDGITYFYSDAHTRVAYDAENHTEEQVIVPAYVKGDLIYATRAVVGGVLVALTAQPDVFVDWIDVNNDGREWGAA